jgi:hypothetical protein
VPTVRDKQRVRLTAAAQPEQRLGVLEQDDRAEPEIELGIAAPASSARSHNETARLGAVTGRRVAG